MLWERLKRGPPKMKRRTDKNTKTRGTARDWGRGTAVLHQWHGRATTHGRAWPHARPCVRRTAGRASRHGRPCGPCAVLGTFCPGCTAVHPCGTPVRVLFSAVLLFFDARDVLKPLIFLDLTFEVLFPIEICWFLLKWRQTQFRHKMDRRKIVWP